ncbi:MAG: hypothetical protein J5764_02840 [Bacteroidales bacterium]|nr:hypothetical protein [Bacteroidales bacterium]
MNDFVVSMLLLGAISSGGNMPFWSTANSFGLMPEYSGGLALVSASTSFDESKNWKWCWGVSLAAREEKTLGFTFIPDQVYVSGGWRNISLDLGIKHEKQDFFGASPLLGSLSTTAGRLAWSGNTRSMPGYTLRLAPANVPFTKGHLQVFGSWGDYINIDPNSFVKHHGAHSTRFGLKGNIGPASITLAIDHWAQWAGVHPTYGQMPLSFVDYCRMVTGSHGGATSTKSDQINVIGNQLGCETIRFDWKGDGWSIAAQHEIPYEDKSGMKFQNFPDGVNTIAFSFDDKKKWVTDIVYEFQYTMLQSGSVHGRLATEEEIASGKDPRMEKYGDGKWYITLGGLDNYSNNGEYASGWTAWGRCKGNPLFFSAGTRKGTLDYKGLVKGVENNRLKAHHVGISGALFHKIPYRLMLTWSRNYGTYGAPYERNDTKDGVPQHQFSSAFNAQIPFLDGSLLLMPGIWCDAGQVLPFNFAATVGLRYMIQPLKKTKSSSK